MTKVTFTADADVTVTSRNIQNGQDGSVVTVAKGEFGTIEIDHGNQAVFSTDAVPGVAPSNDAPLVTKISEEEATANAKAAAGNAETDDTDKSNTFVDATDQQVVDTLAKLNADPATKRVTNGMIDSGALNSALATQGLNPVSATKRDELSTLHGYVKA